MSPFWILFELKMTEVVSGDNWSYDVQSSSQNVTPPTNQHPTVYRPDVLPVGQQVGRSY